MSTHIKKQGGVILAMIALPVAVLIAPFLIAMFAALVSSFSMSLP